MHARRPSTIRPSTARPALARVAPPPVRRGPPHRRRSRGAAVLMALFVATLATVIVSTLFWNQFVLLRTIENQQIVSQSRLLLRGALDWARGILREDATRSSVDALSEPWATGLAETRLDQLGETSTLAAQASMSGQIEDAQARFNLRNLVGPDGKPDPRERDALRRLMKALELPEAMADLVAVRMCEALSIVPAAPPGTGAGTGTGSGTLTGGRQQQVVAADENPRPLPVVLPGDLAGIPGIDASAAARLAPFIVALDERTPINFNTAAAEVIAARVDGLSLSEARALAADRDRTYFKDTGDLLNRLRGHTGGVRPEDMAVGSRYFFVRGQIRLERAVTRTEALVKRNPPGQPAGPIYVLWQREL